MQVRTIREKQYVTKQTLVNFEKKASFITLTVFASFHMFLRYNSIMTSWKQPTAELKLRQPRTSWIYDWNR